MKEYVFGTNFCLAASVPRLLAMGKGQGGGGGFEV